MVEDRVALFVDSRKYPGPPYTWCESRVEQEMDRVIHLECCLSTCVVGRESWKEALTDPYTLTCSKDEATEGQL
jgi:hypothetical protein